MSVRPCLWFHIVEKKGLINAYDQKNKKTSMDGRRGCVRLKWGKLVKISKLINPIIYQSFR